MIEDSDFCFGKSGRRDWPVVVEEAAAARWAILRMVANAGAYKDLRGVTPFYE